MIVEISKEREIELIEKVAKFIVERKLAPAALMTIESLRPLNFLGSQIMIFVAPFAQILFKAKEYQEFAVLIEKDENINHLLNRIDELDEEIHREERNKKRLQNKARNQKIKTFFNKLLKKKNGGKYEQ